MSTDNETTILNQLYDGTNKLILIKVPKYLSEGWMEAAKNGISDIGTIAFTGEDSLSFCSENIEAHYELGRSIASTTSLPIKHSLQLKRKNEGDKPYIVTDDGNNQTLIGHIAYKGDLKPDLNDQRYVDLKRKAHADANTPTRTIRVLENHHQAYKPKSIHQCNIELDANKKTTTGIKRERGGKVEVTEILLSAFEKCQFYNIRDLCRMTNQPLPFLKEILRDICQYNTKPPNKYMYELKPEYRHYKT